MNMDSPGPPKMLQDDGHPETPTFEPSFSQLDIAQAVLLQSPIVTMVHMKYSVYILPVGNAWSILSRGPAWQ